MRPGKLGKAYARIAFQDSEKEKRAGELVIANKELVFQKEEKKKRAAELSQAGVTIRQAQTALHIYIHGMKEMMYMTSHKIRQPVTSMLGLLNLLDKSIYSPVDLKKMLDYMKQSVVALDIYTKELTAYMWSLMKSKKKE